jgi:hypothetical protein
MSTHPLAGLLNNSLGSGVNDDVAAVCVLSGSPGYRSPTDQESSHGT